jgi:hypothetical protein
VIAAEGPAAVGRMIAAYHRSDGAATDFKIAWLTVTLRDLEGHQRFLCPDGSRASAVVDRWVGNVVRRRSPGKWRRPRPCSLGSLAVP